MFNKRELKVQSSAKKLAKPKDIDYVSKMGYRDDSPFRTRPSIDIHTPTGVIDMSNTGIPLIANNVYLPPYSGQYQFDTNVVTEKRLKNSKLDNDNITPYEAEGGPRYYNQDIMNSLHRGRQKDRKDWLHQFEKDGTTPQDYYNMYPTEEDFINQNPDRGVAMRNGGGWLDKYQEGGPEKLISAPTLPGVTVYGSEPTRILNQNKVIQQNKPNKNYSIIDKTNNRVYYYTPDGNLINSENVITGKSNNDIDKGLSMKDWFEKTGSSSHEDYFKYLEENKAQTTPAGVYTISSLRENVADDPNKLGRFINTFRPERAKEIRDSRLRDYGDKEKMFTLQSEYGIGSSKAIHGTGNQKRIDAFNTPGTDRNLSNGCINVNGETKCFDNLGRGSSVYILPEQSDELLYPKSKEVLKSSDAKNIIKTKNKIQDVLNNANLPYDPQLVSFLTSVAEKETKGGRSKIAQLQDYLPYALAKSQGTFQINPESFKKYLPENYTGNFDDQVKAVYNFYNENKGSNLDTTQMYQKYSGDTQGIYSNKFNKIYDIALSAYQTGGPKIDRSLMDQPNFASETVQSQVAYKEDPFVKANNEAAAVERNRLAYIEQEKQRKADEEKLRERSRAAVRAKTKSDVERLKKGLYYDTDGRPINPLMLSEDILVDKDIAKGEYNDKIEHWTNIAGGLGVGALAGITAPLWAPAVAGAAGTVGAALEAPAVIGNTTLPWLTGNNVMAAYFGSKIPKNIEEGEYLEAGLNALPFLGPGKTALREAFNESKSVLNKFIPKELPGSPNSLQGITKNIDHVSLLEEYKRLEATSPKNLTREQLDRSIELSDYFQGGLEGTNKDIPSHINDAYIKHIEDQMNDIPDFKGKMEDIDKGFESFIQKLKDKGIDPNEMSKAFGNVIERDEFFKKYGFKGPTDELGHIKDIKMLKELPEGKKVGYLKPKWEPNKPIDPNNIDIINRIYTSRGPMWDPSTGSFSTNPKLDFHDRFTGYTDVPAFNQGVNELKAVGEFGKQPLETMSYPPQYATGNLALLGNLKSSHGDISPINSPILNIHPEGNTWTKAKDLSDRDKEWLANNFKDKLKDHKLYTGKQAFKTLTPNKFGGQSNNWLDKYK